MQSLVGIDPGETTGMVFAIMENEFDLTIMDAVQAKSIEEALNYLDQWQPDTIIMEAFQLYPWMAKSLSWDTMLPSQVIGAVKAWVVDGHKDVKLVMQPASARIIAKQHVRKYEKYPFFKGKPHAKDALRHIGYYLLKNYPKALLKESLLVMSEEE